MKSVSPSAAAQKIRHFCAYQERSHLEVRNKLFSYGLHGDDVDDLMVSLIRDGYLNEERFARTFAGGKFRMKGWGRKKIEIGLQAHGVSAKCIALGLREIDADDYLLALDQLLEKRISVSEEQDLFVKRDQVARFAIARGFEPDLVWERLKAQLP